MVILVSGSLAYDTIMVFPDQFKKHILADQMHILNVRLEISAANVRRLDDHFTAQAFITTDIDDNQITAFHPGAMSLSHLNRVADAPDARLAIVSPAGREGMIEHANALASAGVPFIFDPGQGLPMFSGEELLELVSRATCLAVNDYEARMVEQKTGLAIRELARRIDAVAVTRGEHGSMVLTRDGRVDIPAVRPDKVVDPTGCGDAYRAGLLYGMARGWRWAKAARLASVMGAIKIGHRGGQNHHPAKDDIARRFRDAFGETL